MTLRPSTTAKTRRRPRTTSSLVWLERQLDQLEAIPVEHELEAVPDIDVPDAAPVSGPRRRRSWAPGVVVAHFVAAHSLLHRQSRP